MVKRLLFKVDQALVQALKWSKHHFFLGTYIWSLPTINILKSHPIAKKLCLRVDLIAKSVQLNKCSSMQKKLFVSLNRLPIHTHKRFYFLNRLKVFMQNFDTFITSKLKTFSQWFVCLPPTFFLLKIKYNLLDYDKCDAVQKYIYKL